MRGGVVSSPGFFSRSCCVFADEFLPLLLYDLLRCQTLVPVLNRLLGRGGRFLHFGWLGGRSWIQKREKRVC